MRLKSYIRRDDVDFRTGVIPVLHACADYFATIANLFLRETNEESVAQEKKIALEQVLQTQKADFPEWVYANGFNPTLREGHRHFLVRVEQMSQILFALHYVSRHAVDLELLDSFRKPIQDCVRETNKLITVLVERLELKKAENSLADFDNAFASLNAVFQQSFPASLELSDRSQDYLYLAAFIYDVNDLQSVLLKLIEALRD